MAKSIKKATKLDGDLWRIEYNEFEGTYYSHDTEYKLQRFIDKVLQERTILPKEIEKLLDLHSDVIEHDRSMEECD